MGCPGCERINATALLIISSMRQSSMAVQSYSPNSSISSAAAPQSFSRSVSAYAQADDVVLKNRWWPSGHVAIIGCDGLIQRGRARTPGPTRSIYAAAASDLAGAGKTKSAAFCASDAARKIARLSSLSAFSQPST